MWKKLTIFSSTYSFAYNAHFFACSVLLNARLTRALRSFAFSLTRSLTDSLKSSWESCTLLSLFQNVLNGSALGGQIENRVDSTWSWLWSWLWSIVMCFATDKFRKQGKSTKTRMSQMTRIPGRGIGKVRWGLGALSNYILNAFQQLTRKLTN